MTESIEANAIVEAALAASSRGLQQSAKWLHDFCNEHHEDAHASALLSVDRKLGGAHYNLAKAAFDCREYARCAFLLKRADRKDEREYFLYFYARYLASEKDRQEEGELLMGPRDTQPNKELPLIVAEMRECMKQHDWDKDTYLLYLLGLGKRQLGSFEDAIPILIQAVYWEPYNFAAWQELILCITSPAILTRVRTQLPTHFMTDLFDVTAQLDLHKSGPDLALLLDSLVQRVPNSSHIKRLQAIHAYNAQDFEQAERLFASLHATDPHGLDGMDIYSNVLFVLERRAELGTLARTMMETDRFRPETCCVVGNYYSLQAEHEKAVQSFRKALKLNRNYLSAWTLMGHEYVELKNTHAAIESYRRAVDVNRKDYRAWYGLGQTYEMLEMHHYALHYFQRAAALKPYDVRMWTAVGGCYEKLGRIAEAIKAFKRALLGGEESVDPSYLARLGDLYEQMGDLAASATYFNACVNAAEGSVGDTDRDVQRARFWLARYHLAAGRIAEAEVHAMRISELEEGKAILKDIALQRVA